MLFCIPVHAEPLSVLDLRLHPGSEWQRGMPQREEEDGALQLSMPADGGAALQVLVPLDPPLIKSEAQDFYRHLQRKWAAQYGKEAAVDWIHVGGVGQEGRRWLACRRPSRSGEGVVFHLATVHEGRAYSLLAFAPTGTESLPPAVHALVTGAGFHAMPRPWRRTLSLPVVPQDHVLEALAQVESDALGNRGMLTGYGVKGTASARQDGAAPATSHALQLGWFLDGFRWAALDGRDERQPFEVRGHLSAEAGPDLEGGVLRVELKVAAANDTVKAQVSRHAYCGPQATWDEALSALARGARGPLVRLALNHGCPGAGVGGGDGVLTTLEAGPGQTATQTMALKPPPEGATHLWMEVRPLPAAGATGEVLLDRTGLYFVFEPGR
jgi:hypothetical protein